MEFLLFLTPEAKEAIDLLKQANVSVIEDAAPCWQKSRLYGAFQKEKMMLIICTQNIKRSGIKSSINLNETLLHESVHVAQYCNKDKPIGISKHNMKLSPMKKQFLEISSKISNKKNSRAKEREAYWLEKKPNMVISALKKYC